MDLNFLLAGAISGLLIGLTGVGGGAIMTPLLIMLGVEPLTAVGTDLWFAAITKLMRTGISHRSGQVDWVIVNRLWTGSLTTSFLITALMLSLRIEDFTTSLLQSSIAIVVSLTAISLLFNPFLHSFGRESRLSNETRFKRAQGPLTILFGIGLGSIVTLTSVGAGAIGVVVLSYLYPLRMTPRRLISTDIAHAIPLAVLAGLGHAISGNIDIQLLVNILAGSIPAVLIGTNLTSIISEGILRYLLAAVLAGVGINLWFYG